MILLTAFAIYLVVGFILAMMSFSIHYPLMVDSSKNEDVENFTIENKTKIKIIFCTIITIFWLPFYIYYAWRDF